MEHARIRWVDGVVDAVGERLLGPVHRLHDAFLALISDRYPQALGSAVSNFLPTLANLHARHAVSLALDVYPPVSSGRPMSLDDSVKSLRQAWQG
jgi:hypothetical protein